MSDTILSGVVPGTGFVWDRDRHGHGDRDYRGWDPAFAHLIGQATANVQALQAQGERGQVAAARDAGEGIAKTGEAMNATERSGQNTINAVHGLSEKVCEDRLSQAEYFGDLKVMLASESDRVGERFFGVQKSLCELGKQASDQHAISQVALTSGFKDALRDNAVNTAQIQVQVLTGFKDALIDSTKNAAATALAAAVNTAAIQASIAECCCEMKELVREESDKTRSVMNEIKRLDDLRRLEKAYGEIQYLKARLPIGTPV